MGQIDSTFLMHNRVERAYSSKISNKFAKKMSLVKRTEQRARCKIAR